MRADLPPQGLRIGLVSAECGKLQAVRVDIEDNLVFARPARRGVCATVAAVAVCLQARREPLPVRNGHGDGQVASDRPQSCAADLDGVELRLLVPAGDLDALGLERNEIETLVLGCPECIEVLRLGMARERIDIRACAAIEEHGLLHVFKGVHGLLPLRGRRVAKELLRVALAGFVHNIRLKTDESSFVELCLVRERHALQRDASLLDSPEIVRALPVKEIFARRHCAVQIHGREGERHLLASTVRDGILVSLTLYPCLVKQASERRTGAENRSTQQFK